MSGENTKKKIKSNIIYIVESEDLNDILNICDNFSSKARLIIKNEFPDKLFIHEVYREDNLWKYKVKVKDEKQEKDNLLEEVIKTFRVL